MLDTKWRKADTLFLSRMRGKIRRGFSPIVLIVGEQRSGKTWLAIRLAEELQPDFDVEKQLVTNMNDFGKVLASSTQQVLILDECGIMLDPMRSAEVTQRVYSHIVQSQAVRQNIIILCLPCASDFGKGHKTHIDVVIEVKGHNKEGAFAKFYGLTHWRANPNDVDLKTWMVEYVSGIPPPSEINRNKYMNKVQMQTKDNILSEELSVLADALYKKERLRRHRLGKTSTPSNKPTATTRHETTAVPSA